MLWKQARGLHFYNRRQAGEKSGGTKNRKTAGGSKMTNYIYGVATMFLFSTAIGVVDQNISNSLWYYIDLYMPF
ncbi:MAG TPA: hypothetical protein PKX87_06625 [Alphaproteobacteria bacterium]|nr:hypothetical protein [Alphaproteobacteria bacterium]